MRSGRARSFSEYMSVCRTWAQSFGGNESQNNVFQNQVLLRANKTIAALLLLKHIRAQQSESEEEPKFEELLAQQDAAPSFQQD